MKEIIYNENNIKDKEINNIVKRAKIVLINSKEEILLCYSNKNYFLLGGHVENNETDLETLKRETLEEAGIELDTNKITPYFSIKQYIKDYPEKNMNSKYIATFFYTKTDKNTDITKTKLTNEEKEGNFKLVYINKNIIIDTITKSLETCTRDRVVKDTILALKEFLNIYK